MNAWIIKANCTDRGDLFFPPRWEHAAARRRRVNRAKAICAACPVISECRDLGLEAERLDIHDVDAIPDGIWGGLTRTELLEYARNRTDLVA